MRSSPIRHALKGRTFREAAGLPKPQAAMSGDRPSATHALQAAFETILRSLSVAIVIVDAKCRVQFANRTALTMFEAGHPVCSKHGELQAPSAEANTALAAAVGLAANGESLRSSHGVPLAHPAGNPAIAYVEPLDHKVSAPQMAVVYVTTMQDHPAPSVDALITLYDLTPTEVRVLVEIAAGKNRAQTALALGVADSTVKTHLARVFEKTSTSEQSELARLVASLAPPAAARPRR